MAFWAHPIGARRATRALPCSALPEMSDRKRTAVDRPVGGRWRSYSPVVRGRPACFALFIGRPPCGPRALPRMLPRCAITYGREVNTNPPER